MPAFIERLKSQPWIAHLLEALARYGERLGGQFAAAITYFSVLAIVPVLMVAFAALGLTVTLLLPDILAQVKGWIINTVSDSSNLGEQLGAVVDQAFNSWAAVGPIGLVSAAWAGANWVNNIRSAVHAMMRPAFDLAHDRPGIVIQTVKNLGILLTLFVLVALSMAMTTVATTARNLVGSFIGVDGVAGGSVLLALIPVVGTLLAGFLLFAFLLTVFPEERVPGSTLAKGAAIGAVGMAALQYLTGTLVSVFSGNAAAAVFGSVIVVMLFFNLFATLILVVAAWVATHPDHVRPPVTYADHAPAAPTDYATKLVAAELRAAREREETERVPTEVAVRSTRVGMGLGALFGGALAGFAALIAAVLSGLRQR